MLGTTFQTDPSKVRHVVTAAVSVLLTLASVCVAVESGDGVGAATVAAEATAETRTPRRKLHGFPPLFTHPPAAIGAVKEILPLGNVNGVDHIIPVDHMYLGYPNGPNGGADTVQIQAMAAGELVMVARRIEAHVPTPDYSIWIRHTGAVTSQYEHVHGLPSRISDHLASTGAGWVAIDPSFEIMFLGQLGAPEPLELAAGENVGVSRSYSQYWDLGIIDTQTRGRFSGRLDNHYPTIEAYAALLGLGLDHPPFAGQATLNAGCFVNYMTPQLRGAWSDLLAGAPGDCGRAGWDVDGRLRGTWFNPLIDTTEPPPLFDDEWAALSIVPYNLAPSTQVQIAIASGHALAAVDPAGAYPQLRRRLLVTIDPSPGTRVNPDPAGVAPATGVVCYDLRYPDDGGERYNALLLRLAEPDRLEIAFDPAPTTSSRCAALLAAGEPAWITTYVR